MKLFKTEQAQEDLIEIWASIGVHNEGAANRLIEQIDARLSLLREFPEMGAPRSDIRIDLRMLVIGEYLVIYRLLPEEVEIVRVVYGRRDIAALEP